MTCECLKAAAEVIKNCSGYFVTAEEQCRTINAILALPCRCRYAELLAHAEAMADRKISAWERAERIRVYEQWKEAQP
jgi:hypothetical protein